MREIHSRKSNSLRVIFISHEPPRQSSPIVINRYSFVLKSMSPSTPDLHAPLMQYSLPNNYYTSALHLLRAGSRDPAESASPVTPASSPLLLFPLFVIHDLPLLDPEIRRTQSLTVFSSSKEKLMKAGHMSKFRPSH